jgi:predicted aspartyl protease
MPLITPMLALAFATQSPVEVPFRIAEDAIIVDATVNNAKVALMFDTGFSGAVVLNDAIDIGKPSGYINMRDFVGEFQAKKVDLKSLKLGDKAIDSKGMYAVQQPVGHMSFGYNAHTDGIMGFEVIRNNITEISFQKSRFIFHPKTLDISSRVPDNKKTFLGKLLPIGHNSLEMEVVAPSGKKLTLALDTGNAFYATTHRDVLERVGLWTAAKQPQFMKQSGVASGTVDSWSVRLSNMNIFGVPVPTSVWDIIDAPSSSAEGDGTVGFGFLKNFNIIIDYDRRRVWMENFTGVVSEDPPGDIGVFAFNDPRAKVLRVYHVAPDSPAAKAGIKEGDAILSVDGEDLAGKSYRQIRSSLQGPKGSKVKLAVSREGVLKRYTLERAHLVNE